MLERKIQPKRTVPPETCPIGDGDPPRSQLNAALAAVASLAPADALEAILAPSTASNKTVDKIAKATSTSTSAKPF